MGRNKVVEVGKALARVRTAALGLAMAALLSVCPLLVHAKGPLLLSPASTMQVAELPAQGRDMYALIHQGGPFRYDKDGSVFGNRERVLPGKARGFYREYTVKTPGERTRGARRIICGGERPAAPQACYYTEDHYASFRRIVQ
jgi:ribonuclease T1